MTPRKRKNNPDLPRGLYMHRRQFRCRAWLDETGKKHPTKAVGLTACWMVFDPPLADASKAFYEFRGKEEDTPGVMELQIRRYMREKVPKLMAEGKMAATTWRTERPRCEKLIHHFGHMHPRDIRKSHIYAVIEWHKPQAGKKLIKRLSAIYRHLIRWEKADINPCEGIEYVDDDARTRRVLDSEYEMAVCVALDRAFWSGHGSAIVYAVLRLELLTGRRQSDVLRIELRDLTNEGIMFNEAKSKKSTLVLWTDELRQAVADAKHVCHRQGKVVSTRLITNRDGMPVSEGSLNQAWQRLRPWMDMAGIEPFQIRDIRAKHATDFDGDATANLRHSSKAVTEKHYIRRPVKVRSLR